MRPVASRKPSPALTVPRYTSMKSPQSWTGSRSAPPANRNRNSNSSRNHNRNHNSSRLPSIPMPIPSRPLRIPRTPSRSPPRWRRVVFLPPFPLLVLLLLWLPPLQLVLLLLLLLLVLLLVPFVGAVK